jgi:hypothetical protein
MFRLILVCSLAFAMSPLEQHAGALTAAEVADGWKLLFDGHSLSGWRAYKSTTPPAGWKAVNGELVRAGDGGDLMTVEEYSDFELRLEWKISENGNSGIMYHVAKGDEFPYESGPEFQILHNAGHKDGANPITSAGSNYAMHPSAKDVTRRVGEWNDIRQGHARRTLDERREAARVRAVQPRLVRAAQGQQVRQDAALRSPHARTPRPAGPRQPGHVPEHQDKSAIENRNHEVHEENHEAREVMKLNASSSSW